MAIEAIESCSDPLGFQLLDRLLEGPGGLDAVETSLTICRASRGFNCPTDSLGEELCIQLVPSEGVDTTDLILQFPDVTGPTMLEQCRDQIIGHLFCGSRFLVEALEEVAGDESDIFSSIAKRRQMHIDDIEAVVQIFTKSAVSYFRGEVEVCRREYSYIDLDGLLSSNSTNHTLLDHSQ